MPKDLTKFHPQPCANCGHRDMHGEVAGTNRRTPGRSR